jgi:prepilin-type N-terminal cleavage/methylation domain-containing protein
MLGAYFFAPAKKFLYNIYLLCYNSLKMNFILSLFDGGSSKAGFTLLEMVLVLAVLSLGFIPLVNMFSDGMVASKDATNNAVAVQLAQQKMEQVKGLSYANIESSSESFGQIPGYGSFQRTVTASTAEGLVNLLNIEVRVDWYSGKVLNNYTLSTLITNY